MLIQENLSIEEKLRILSDAAKYDAACTSSGVGRKGKEGFLGNSRVDGICHSFASDGRCISLLKIYLRTSASMTVITVSTVGAMTRSVPPLRRRRSAV